MPKVSVIIPTFNMANFIAEAIQSVLDQTFQDFEIVVVDDGSTDNTKQVVDSFQHPRIRYIYQENQGVSAARNTGLSASTGEYIALLDSDDAWLPRNLELKVKMLDSRPDIALVCSDMYLFDSDTGADLGRLWRDFFPWFNLQKATEQPMIQLLSRGCFIGPGATIARRLVFNEVGYFDESLQAAEDFDIYVRVLQRFSLGIINMPLVRWRRHRASLTANFEKMYWAEVAALNKVIRSHSLTKVELKLVRRRLARAHLNYGWQKIRMVDEIASGREKLLVSISIYPWSIWPYIYLALSLLGGRVINILKSWRKLIKRYLILMLPIRLC